MVGRMTKKPKHLVLASRRRSGLATRLGVSDGTGGKGSLTVREVFSGIRLVLVDVHDVQMLSGEAVAKVVGTWGLLHVARGGCVYQEDAKVSGDDMHGIQVDMAPGDIAAVEALAPQEIVQLPSERLRALLLSMDDAEILQEVRLVMRTFFELDSTELQTAFFDGHAVRALAANLDASHVFSELYATFAHADLPYIRLKCLELLTLCIRGIEPNVASEPSQAQALPVVGKHVAIAYRAQAAMVADIAHTPTIASLAEQCKTSPTVLKEAFRESFGMPIYTWFKHYRIQRACELLEEDRTRSIASVAAEVGYANPSKFSKAFSDCMGTTPYAWREGRR